MKKLLLSAILVGFLTACSGGGGSSGSGTVTTPDNTKVDLDNSAKGDIGAKTTDGELYGQNSNDSFYGIWINDAKTVKKVHYQEKTAATNLPSGTATYLGDAYWVNGTTGQPSKGGKTT
ncbi:hypothetical protein [Haemophilus sputorum]